MIAGHFGLAAAVKGVEREVPLWSLMLATVWLDIVFVPLLAVGVETIDEVPGTDGGYGDNLIHAEYTHSLVGALALSVLFGAWAWRRWGTRVGYVLGAVAFSHWLLDLATHRKDLPILPGDLGDLPELGFGLWKAHAASAIVEAVILIVGVALYHRAARAVARERGDAAAVRRADVVTAVLALGGALVLGIDLLVGV